MSLSILLGTGQAVLLRTIYLIPNSAVLKLRKPFTVSLGARSDGHQSSFRDRGECHDNALRRRPGRI